ncbi:MAG: DUF805 domain-containing protein [Helicobacteraceae bacterium]|jgi:uncharacterized membrane protein YhaH (DUF805 family)|nr:DUF805 domain-containing protein [Helicobacteraceae bacterium]
MEAVKGWFQVWLDHIVGTYKGLGGGAKALEGGVFSGRMAIRHFWTYLLVNIVIAIVLGVIDGIVFISILGVPATPLGSIFGLATLIPSLSAGIRRMHDIGKVGWWILAPLYNLYLWAQKANEGENQYGAPATDIAA